MPKKNPKEKAKRLLLITTAILFSIFSFSSFINPRVYAADSSNFALYVGDTKKERAELADLYDVMDDDYGSPGWSIIRIFAKNLFRQGQTTITFDQKLTEEISCTDSALGGCSNQEPVYTQRYYCTLPNHTPTFNRPGAGREYYEVVYAIGLKGNGSDGNAFVNRDTFNATGGVILAKKYLIPDGSDINKEEVVYDITDHVNSPDDFDDAFKGNQNDNNDRFGIDDADQACRPSPSVVGPMQIPNYYKLSASQKRGFRKETVGPGSTTPSGADDNPECSVQLTSPLSWLICPVVEVGAEFTDFVYTNFIEGLLEQNPISTNPNNAGFKTWQQLRILGNIVLIGALLVLVYGQIRGGR